MRLNSQFQQIQQSATVAAADSVLKLKARGRGIIPLHVGDPDFLTPETIVEEGVRALRNGETHYGPSRGFLELREAAAKMINVKADAPPSVGTLYDPEEEILITHGGVHAYYLAMQSILNPGDDVLVPDPSWPTHKNMITLLRCNVIPVATSPEKGFIPDIEDWRQHLTEKTKALVINYPSNPTGAIASRNRLKKFVEFARENDLWVVSDEVYDNISFGEKPVSVSEFPSGKDHVILINSLSKTYAMTGWRVGYIAAPKRVIENALKASQNSITCVAPFIQKAAAFALTDEAVQKEAVKMRTAYSRRRDLVITIHEEYGNSRVNLIPPLGAFYFFLDLRELKMPSTEIYKKILNEAGVGLVPGTAFGVQGEGFVRMTIAASDADVEEGFRAILDWAERQ